MNYKTLGIIGIITAFIGYIKTYLHTGTLRGPFSDSFCGKPPTSGELMDAMGHCWGCVVAPLGLGLLAVALFLWFRSNRSSS